MTDSPVPAPLAFRVDSRDVQGASVVEVAGEVDAHTAPTVHDAVEAAIAPGARVIVDLREVSFLDSTGLGVFVTALKHVRDAEATLDLVITSARVLKVFELTGLDVVIPIHEEMPPLLESRQIGRVVKTTPRAPLDARPGPRWRVLLRRLRRIARRVRNPYGVHCSS